MIKQPVLIVFIGFLSSVFILGCFLFLYTPSTHTSMSFHTQIMKVTEENQDFRHVLFTGQKTQIVVMSIPPGGEVGKENHAHVEQVLFFQAGSGEAILDGKSSPISPGDLVVVTPGTEHNFRNTGTVPMKILTVYSAPNHIDGRIQHTIADEKADTADEAFGEAVR